MAVVKMKSLYLSEKGLESVEENDKKIWATRKEPRPKTK